jgi:cation diffusion facilitator CzcD-associated flavoprotein CzcO
MQYSTKCDVAVIGAGPYGLSVAAHLRAAGVDTKIFGEPMGFWRNNMPQGMTLRSPWQATHLSDPSRRFTLDDFFDADVDRSVGLARDKFVDYGTWFQRSGVGEIDPRRVQNVAPDANGFELALDDGSRLAARRVVVAVGLRNQELRPLVFAGLPRDLVSHSADHSTLAPFAARRVAVIGGGQSAGESAALLNEAGADVTLISRDRIRFLGEPGSAGAARRAARNMLGTWLSAPSQIGSFPYNYPTEFPQVLHRLPQRLRAWHSEIVLAATCAHWVRPRLAGVRIDEGRQIRRARRTGNIVSLTLDNGRFEFDHVLLATGFSLSVAQMGLFEPAVLDRMDCHIGSPVLSRGLQSSIPGLYFAGSSAVMSYGAQLRFVAGVDFAARNIARSVLGARGRLPAPSAGQLDLSPAV